MRIEPLISAIRGVVAESAVSSIFAFSSVLESVAHSLVLLLGLAGQVALVSIAMSEAALITIFAGSVLLPSVAVACRFGTISTATTTRTTRARGFLLSTRFGFGIGVRSAMAVGALLSKAAVAFLREISADFDTVLVVLGSLVLGLVLLASGLSLATTSSSSLGLAVGLVFAFLGSLLLLGLLGAFYVLVLAAITVAASASLLIHAAHLLFTAGILSPLRTVGLTLVLSSMYESAAITKLAGLVLGPVVAISLGFVISLRHRNRFAFGVLVLAISSESALSVIVAERSADLLLSVLPFVVGHSCSPFK
jgi:hypothetical protein